MWQLVRRKLLLGFAWPCTIRSSWAMRRGSVYRAQVAQWAFASPPIPLMTLFLPSLLSLPLPFLLPSVPLLLLLSSLPPSLLACWLPSIRKAGFPPTHAKSPVAVHHQVMVKANTHLHGLLAVSSSSPLRLSRTWAPPQMALSTVGSCGDRCNHSPVPPGLYLMFACLENPEFKGCGWMESQNYARLYEQWLCPSFLWGIL